ncbi:MAG TPA: PP2C family protein-serine/threonine phosphatase [Terriglobales bacterium]|nr:PP2C family protein-serine/threonine phosphatase [Terriglobales bacterium]
MSKGKDRAREWHRENFWKAVPISSRISVLVAVFCLFAAIGLLTLLIRPVKHSTGYVLATILISGGCAVAYAWLATIRKYWYMPILGVSEALLFALLGSHYAAASLVNDGEALQKQLSVLGALAILTICLGYVLFIVFIRRESGRYFRMQTEMELAREIHRSLVPRFERTIGRFEIFGASIASGAVGGDLVDLAESPGGWISYIADISGHGVSSGVLMAMFKTSIRSRMANGGSPNELLEEVHRTLFPLKMPNMFVTAGVLQLQDGNRVNFSLAGHPPLLRYSRAEIKVFEHGAQNMPLGIVAEQRFCGDVLHCDPGDILLLLTDGFSEVFNADGNELGLEPLKSKLAEIADQPLPHIFDSLRGVSLKFGRQEDDQTMLLLRYAQ